jgi:hypothetical protein
MRQDKISFLEFAAQAIKTPLLFAGLRKTPYSTDRYFPA